MLIKILLPFWIATFPPGVRDDVRGVYSFNGKLPVAGERESRTNLLNALKEY